MNNFKNKLKISSMSKFKIDYILKKENEKSKLYTKAIVINSVANGYKIKNICDELKISRKTIYNYLNNFIKYDYKYFEKPESKARLNKIKDELKSEFSNSSIPETYVDAKKRIYNKFGIKISETQIREFFIKNNIDTQRSKCKIKINESLNNRKIKSGIINGYKSIKKLKKNIDAPIFNELDKSFILWLSNTNLDNMRNKNHHKNYGYRSYDNFNELSYIQIKNRIYYRTNKLTKYIKTQ